MPHEAALSLLAKDTLRDPVSRLDFRPGVLQCSQLKLNMLLCGHRVSPPTSSLKLTFTVQQPAVHWHLPSILSQDTQGDHDPDIGSFGPFCAHRVGFGRV
jgi:hypothetical protein